jgi:predicted alpha/beta hydrolase family esterase
VSAWSLVGDAVAGLRGLGRYRNGSDRPGDGPVTAVLVHGYGSHPGHLQAWAQVAAAHECTVRHVAYRPWEPYDRVAGRVRDVLEAATICGAPVVVLAHSLGGVLVREALVGLDHSVECVVTVGSPHGGSRWAGWSQGCAKAVEPGSPELARVEEAWVAQRQEARWVTVGMADDVVVDAGAAVLDGAEQLVLDGVGHLGAIEDPRVLAVVDGAVRSCVRAAGRRAR